MQDPQFESNVDSVPGQPPAIFIGSDVFRRPAFGGNHPLNIIRHSAVVDLARALGWLDDDNFRECSPASVSQLVRFHDRGYISALQYADSEGRVSPEVRNTYQLGTMENPVFPGLFERAATTVGGSILAAELALEGTHGLSSIRRGTHHGRSDRACGFCYFNDPVFAILTLLDAQTWSTCSTLISMRIMVTASKMAFFDDERVTTLSIHEDYRWPYSGSKSYAYEGAFNLPVPKGFNDDELAYLFDHAVEPLVERREVDAFVLCCGADCLAGDPLSTMVLSNVALWRAVERVLGWQKPTVIVGGGGYNPWTLTRYWAGLWGRISQQTFPETLPAAASELFASMECDLVDEEDVDPSWMTTLEDPPHPGPVRDSIKSLPRQFLRSAGAA